MTLNLQEQCRKKSTAIRQKLPLVVTDRMIVVLTKYTTWPNLLTAIYKARYVRSA